MLDGESDPDSTLAGAPYRMGNRMPPIAHVGSGPPKPHPSKANGQAPRRRLQRGLRAATSAKEAASSATRKCSSYLPRLFQEWVRQAEPELAAFRMAVVPAAGALHVR